jgi:hypothetical protein
MVFTPQTPHGQRSAGLRQGLSTAQPRRNRRPQRRQLFCPAHPEQRIEGNGQKYFLHLLTSNELKARGMSHKRAQLVMKAYPVLVLSNE